MRQNKIRSIPEIEAIELARVGDQVPRFDLVQSFLVEFGYLDSFEPFVIGECDRSTSLALELYQKVHGLSVTGDFDEQTRTFMSRPRCAVPDNGLLSDGEATRTEVRFVIACGWPSRELTYAIEANVPNFIAHAVHSGFQQWASVCRLEVAPVSLQDRHHIRVRWSPNSVVGGGRIAAADFPPRCSWMQPNTPPPKLVIFDSAGVNWGTGHNQYDPETVALHEIGHSLGLDHSNLATAVMSDNIMPGPNGWKRHLTSDDIAGIRTLYP